MTEKTKKVLEQDIELLERRIVTQKTSIQDMRVDCAAKAQRILDLEVLLSAEYEATSDNINHIQKLQKELQQKMLEKCAFTDNTKSEHLQDALEYSEVQLDEVRTNLMEEMTKSRTLRSTLQALLDAYDGPKPKPFTDPIMFEKSSTDPDRVYGTKG